MKNEFLLRKLKELESFGKEYQHAIYLVATFFVVPTFVFTALTFFENNEVPAVITVADNNKDAGEVKGESVNNNEYESHFNDNNWEINGQWQKN